MLLAFDDALSFVDGVSDLLNQQQLTHIWAAAAVRIDAVVLESIYRLPWGVETVGESNYPACIYTF